MLLELLSIVGLQLEAPYSQAATAWDRQVYR